jgi:murein DD-endopeptidase MepM/ murein hydrolase activator NlpD
VLRLERSDFNVLVVRGDGRFVRWLSVPRWLAKVLVVFAAVCAVGNAAALIDYMNLSRQHAYRAATHDQLERDAKVLPSIRVQLAELREEMVKWEAMHLAILRPLNGQQRTAAAAAAGIGGPAFAGGKSLDDIDALVAHVREESRRLRTLANVTREAGSVLAAIPAKLPLRSSVNSPFGPRLSPWTGQPEFHAGVDLAASPGTPVTATAGGVVRFAGAAEAYGKTIILDHGLGIESRYAHLQQISVASGQRVERGQLIGLSGNTGRSTAPHLHYEVQVNGRAVDPRRLARD